MRGNCNNHLSQWKWKTKQQQKKSQMKGKNWAWKSDHPDNSFSVMSKKKHIQI